MSAARASAAAHRRNDCDFGGCGDDGGVGRIFVVDRQAGMSHDFRQRRELLDKRPAKLADRGGSRQFDIDQIAARPLPGDRE